MSQRAICRISWKEFEITDQEIALLEKLSPVIGGEKFSLPLPTLCPEERRRRRLVFKNYFSLFKRKDESWKTIISIYPPDAKRTVYSQPYWWGDNWDPRSTSIPYIQEESVTHQIHKVIEKTPLPALDNAYGDLENSEYINGNWRSKDCYLISNGNNNESCLYGWFIFQSSNILDANYITECENCSHSQHLWKCYDVHYSWDTSSSRNSRYLFSCDGCEYVLGGVGLENQKYQILNTPCTESEFRATLAKLKTDATFRKEFEIQLQRLIGTIGLKKSITTGSVDSSGDFCYDSKNAYECYNVGNCEDVSYIYNSLFVRDSLDLDQWWENTSLSYNNIDVWQDVSNIYCSISIWGWARYNFYSLKCQACSYIFGCSWLRNASYCIFNVQYTKEEWEKTVKEIIQKMEKEGTWGEFLDPVSSSFAYNESQALEQMPLEKEKAIGLGFRWSDRAEVPPEGITKIIPWDRLPENIADIPDDVLHWAIKCTKTGKLFQIQPLELDMLRRFHMPIPRIHPIERIKMRLEWDQRVFSFDF